MNKRAIEHIEQVEQVSKLNKQNHFDEEGVPTRNLRSATTKGKGVEKSRFPTIIKASTKGDCLYWCMLRQLRIIDKSFAKNQIHLKNIALAMMQTMIDSDRMDLAALLAEDETHDGRE